MLRRLPHSPFFFFNDTATTEIYTLSLHDALPIYRAWLPKAVRADHALDVSARHRGGVAHGLVVQKDAAQRPDRKSIRLNSSHTVISYAVFCLKKKQIPA